MTGRLGIQPNCLHGRYETYAEGGPKKTARRGGIPISSQTGGRSQLDVNNTLATRRDTTCNCQLTDR